MSVSVSLRFSIPASHVHTLSPTLSFHSKNICNFEKFCHYFYFTDWKQYMWIEIISIYLSLRSVDMIVVPDFWTERGMFWSGIHYIQFLDAVLLHSHHSTVDTHKTHIIFSSTKYVYLGSIIDLYMYHNCIYCSWTNIFNHAQTMLLYHNSSAACDIHLTYLCWHYWTHLPA